MTTKYPSLAHYLKNLHPDLYNLCEELDIAKSLSSGKRITFLMPDKATVTKITKLAKNDPEQASLLLSSHFISHLICTPSDFDNFKENLYSINNYLIELKSVGSDSIELSGCSVEINQDPCGAYFRSALAREGSGFAVWLCKGQVEVNTSKRRPMKRRPRERTKVEEVKGDGEAEVMKLREARKEILNNHFIEAAKDKDVAITNLHNKFCRVLSKAFDDENYPFIRLLKSVSGCHSVISFFIALFSEKLWESNNFSEYFTECLKYEGPLTRSYSSLLDYFDDSGAAILSGQVMSGLLDSRDTVKLGIVNSKDNIRFAAEVKAAYNDLEDRNRIGNTTNVYPEGYSKYLSANKGIAFCIDEVKTLLWDALRRCEYCEIVQTKIIEHFIPSLLYNTKVLSSLDGKLDFGTVKDFVIVMSKTMMFDLPFSRAMIRARAEEYSDNGIIYGGNDGIIDIESQAEAMESKYVSREEKIDALKAKVIKGEQITLEDLNDL